MDSTELHFLSESGCVITSAPITPLPMPIPVSMKKKETYSKNHVLDQIQKKVSNDDFGVFLYLKDNPILDGIKLNIMIDDKVSDFIVFREWFAVYGEMAVFSSSRDFEKWVMGCLDISIRKFKENYGEMEEVEI